MTGLWQSVLILGTGVGVLFLLFLALILLEYFADRLSHRRISPAQAVGALRLACEKNPGLARPLHALVVHALLEEGLDDDLAERVAGRLVDAALRADAWPAVVES